MQVGWTAGPVASLCIRSCPLSKSAPLAQARIMSALAPRMDKTKFVRRLVKGKGAQFPPNEMIHYAAEGMRC